MKLSGLMLSERCMDFILPNPRTTLQLQPAAVTGSLDLWQNRPRGERKLQGINENFFPSIICMIVKYLGFCLLFFENLRKIRYLGANLLCVGAGCGS